jgi:hypothetical protein
MHRIILECEAAEEPAQVELLSAAVNLGGTAREVDNL